MSAPVQVIAHRGASARAPENTLVAFEEARRLGANEVELDVQLSRDDELIVFHDRTLEAKTGASGRVRDHDAAFLLGLDIGAWFDGANPDGGERFTGTRLASLDQVFERFGAALYYHIEIKAPGEGHPRATPGRDPRAGARAPRHPELVRAEAARAGSRARSGRSDLSAAAARGALEARAPGPEEGLRPRSQTAGLGAPRRGQSLRPGRVRRQRPVPGTRRLRPQARPGRARLGHPRRRRQCATRSRWARRA